MRRRMSGSWRHGGCLTPEWGRPRRGGSDGSSLAYESSGFRAMIQTLSETGLDIEAYTAARRAEGQPVILDLGCGARKVPGAFGIDIVALPGVDLVHDLEATPYPMPESCADAIHLNHVLEHFGDPLRILEEVWRLAR